MEMSSADQSKQLQATQRLIKLAEQQKDLSEKRTELSAQRSYLNAERTLSVWVRTALAAMIFGIAIDRFGLMFSTDLNQTADIKSVNPSVLTGAVLVFFSMLMAVSAAIRFYRFARDFKKVYSFPQYHNASLPVAYAVMIVVFGAVLLLLMLGIIGAGFPEKTTTSMLTEVMEIHKFYTCT